MEAVLVMPSSDRGREYVLPLSLSGVRVRMVVQTGNQLVAELGREPAECILLPEMLPDGPAELWLAKVAASCPQRPLAVVLDHSVIATESVREKVRSTYGPSVEVVAAGARNVQEVAAETARVLDRLGRLVAEQDRDAFERLRQPVDPGKVPQPVHRGGPVAFLGASGGVGTSTLVTNLATYVAMAGQKVLVIDAHFATAGSILHFFGAQPDEQNYGIHHLRWSHLGSGGAVRDGMSDELIQRLQEVRLRKVRHADLRVLGVPAILDAMVNCAAEQILWAVQVLSRHFDVVLMDCGSGFGNSRAQQLLDSAGRIYLVAGGWGTGVQSLVRGVSAMEGKEQMDRLFILLREGTDGAFGVRTVRSMVNMPVYGRVPDEPLLRKADSRLGIGLPVVAEHPGSSYGKSVAELAYALGLVDPVEQKVTDKRIGRRWFSFSRA